ncbi:MAG: hypothetical protein EOO43_10965, partial [Flavobacterium sp.]
MVQYKLKELESKKRGKHYDMTNIRVSKTENINNHMPVKFQMSLEEVKKYFDALVDDGISPRDMQITAKCINGSFKTIKSKGEASITYGDQYSMTDSAYEHTNRQFFFVDILVYAKKKKGKLEDEYEEGIKGRQRQWFPIEEAMDIVPMDQRNALNKAIASLSKGNFPVHHSDRGIQYCCEPYVSLLQQNHIMISMTQS